MRTVTEHPQVACAWAEDGLVDELMLPLLQWCRGQQIATAYSCQGDTDDIDARYRAYILFRTLDDLDRFFNRLLPLAQRADPDLADRIADSYRGPDWRIRRSRAWRYEVCSTAGSLEPPPLHLWPAVRFPGSDLRLLSALVARDGTAPDSRTPGSRPAVTQRALRSLAPQVASGHG